MEDLTGTPLRVEQIGGVGVVEVGSVDDLEMGAVLDGDPHVRDAHLEELTGALERLGHRRRQQVLPLHRDRGEQARLVAEVVHGRGVRRADATGELAQAQRRGPLLLYDLERGPDQGFSQRAVMVRVGSHAHTLLAI